MRPTWDTCYLATPFVINCHRTNRSCEYSQHFATVPMGQVGQRWRVMLCMWHGVIITTNDAGGRLNKAHEIDSRSTSLCPLCQSLQQDMGGVDHLYQMRAHYGVGRAGRKWWKYLFWGILNVDTVNAYILLMAANRPLHVFHSEHGFYVQTMWSH